MKRSYTATEMMRYDLRRMRTQSLTHMIMSIIGPHLRDDEEGRAYDRQKQILNQLERELEQAGAEIISDYTREQAGLPPRGPDGWTIEEISELEKKRIELLSKPFSPIIISRPDAGEA